MVVASRLEGLALHYQRTAPGRWEWERSPRGIPSFRKAPDLIQSENEPR